jgi:hypothetical protein
MTDSSALKNALINQTPLSQGAFSTSYLQSEAVIDMAYLSNRFNMDIESNDAIIILDPFDITFNDFMSCFYNQSGGSFNINLNNKYFKPLLINNQSYTTTDGKKFFTNLYNLCLKTYSTKNQISENLINTQAKIRLANEVFGFQSLATITGIQNALTWDVCLSTLGATGQIEYTGDFDDEAKVSFKITYVYFSSVLGINISLVFTYTTSIPGYKQIFINNDVLPQNIYSQFENNSIESIKKELKESISNHVSFNQLEKKQIMSPQQEEDASLDDENTINTKTIAMLKNLQKDWNDEEEVLDEDDDEAVW